MLIDILLIGFIIIGFINGYRRGLIYSIFAFVSLFLGIMLSMKYSYIVSTYLYQQEYTQSKYLPFISFLSILFAVLIVFKIFYKLIQSAVDSLFLGGINKFIGGVIWTAILVIMYSTVLWYLDKLHLIPAEMKDASKSYQYISSFAPIVIGELSKLVPFFQGVFQKIEDLFKEVPAAYTSQGIQA